MATENKDIIIRGIGKGFIRDKITGKVLYWDKGQTLNVELNTSSEDVYGGDGLAPIYTYATQVEGTVTFTNATFKANQLSFMLASEISTTGVKSKDIVDITKSTTQLGSGELTNVKVLYVTDPDGEIIQCTQTGTAQANQIDISDTGEVQFGTSTKEGTYRVLYEYDATGTQTVVLADSLPNPVEVHIVFYPEDLDGNKKVMNIDIPHARCDGNVTFETGRDSAGTPELVFKILKQEDLKNTMTITVSDMPNAAGE